MLEADGGDAVAALHTLAQAQSYHREAIARLGEEHVESAAWSNVGDCYLRVAEWTCHVLAARQSSPGGADESRGFFFSGAATGTDTGAGVGVGTGTGTGTSRNVVYRRGGKDFDIDGETERHRDTERDKERQRETERQREREEEGGRLAGYR